MPGALKNALDWQSVQGAVSPCSRRLAYGRVSSSSPSSCRTSKATK
ncbi:hypothetical protein [Streptomyces sp. NPDC031705]